MLIGTFSGPPAPTGGSSSANSYSTIQELLIKIPDNTANQIQPKDLRDSVFTLWEKISNVQIIASQSASASSYYTNPGLVPVSVGGISAGSSFPGTYSMQQMWDLLLYPYISPGAGLGSIAPRQYGSGTSVTLSWSVTKNTNTITYIIVDTLPQSFTGNSQIGTKAATGTHSNTPPISTTNTYTMTCSDGTTTVSASTTLTWMNKRYWGYIDLDGVGVPTGTAPDLTTFPLLSGAVGNHITDTMIKTLNGASANGLAQVAGMGSELSTTREKTYTGINGGGKHLIFAFPSGFGSPSWTVGGFTVNAFTRVKSSFPFVNEYNWSGTSYDVWVSNTAQGSPLNIVIS
jgi:hypothetical protein